MSVHIATCTTCGSTLHAPDARSAAHYAREYDVTCCDPATTTLHV